jgi:hypothetical protein
MREIAYTSFGRNALSMGLVSHFSALIAGMMTVAGAREFFSAAYVLAFLVLAFRAYAELKDRGYMPFRSPGFYCAAGAAVLPVMGPIAALLILYSCQGNKKTGAFTLPGMLASVLRLKVKPLVLIIFLAILFILFALSVTRHDPYFNQVNHERIDT